MSDLKPYQVGENDIVVATTEQQVIDILCNYADLKPDELTVEDVNEQPLSLKLYTEEGDVIGTLGEYMKDVTEAQYLFGWE